MTLLKLVLLGSPQIELNEQTVTLPRRKVLALLIYLVCNRQRHRRDALATLFWPEASQSGARTALRRELYELTSRLGDEWFIIDREHIAIASTVSDPTVSDPTTIDPTAIDRSAVLQTDVEAFRRFIATGSVTGSPPGSVSGSGSAPTATTIDALALQSAVQLYIDDFAHGLVLPDCPEFSEWCAFEAESLRREFAGVLEQLIAWHEAQATYAEAIVYARRWLALDAMNEPAHRALMRLFACNGQHTAAARQYEECMRILHEDLAIQPSTATRELYAAIQARRFPPGAPSAPASTHQPPVEQARGPRLPTPSTPFIGRHDELTAIAQLLCKERSCRLLTLIGPGGIGKTRVALQVAHQLHDASTASSTVSFAVPFTGGIYFAALAAITDPEQLITVLANAVGCPLTGRDEPQRQLENFLRPQKVLLVIDNFEHLLAGGALVADLLDAAAGLSILVTSREALALPVEWLYPLGGLPTPAPDAHLSEIKANNAVQLFVQRAQRVARNFALSAQNAGEIVRICRLVDGMPLGLELAAAWLNTLTLTELADEITSNLDILATELRNIPERHRSLRALFEQTWQRLRPAEQQTLRRLAIFHGAFTREAAEVVAQASLVEISSLVERSLCRYQAGRYDIHELLRQFASARLDEAEARSIRAQHSLYFGRLAAAQQVHLSSAREEQALQLVADEYDNLLAAWRYNLDQLASGAERVRWVGQMRDFVSMLAAYFDRRALFWEGERIFQHTLAALAPLAAQSTAQSVDRPADRSAETMPSLHDLTLLLQVEQAGMGMHLGRYQPAREALSALLPQLRAAEHPQLATALIYLTLAYIRTGEFAKADLCCDEAIDCCRKQDSRSEYAAALINRGVVAGQRREYVAARRAFQEAAQIFEALGYGTGHARCINNIGSTYIGEDGNIQGAMGYYERAHQIAARHNSRLWTAVAITNLGYCAYELGSYEDACVKYQAGLAIFRELRDMRWVMVTLADVSYALIGKGAMEEATACLREALGYVQQYQLIADGLKALGATALVLEARQEHALAVALATHLLDDSRTRSTARQHCARLLATLAATIPEAAYAAAQFQGRSTPYDLMVQRALDSLDGV